MGRPGESGVGEPVGGVLPDAVQEPVPHQAVVGAVHADQRTVDEPGQGVHHGARRDLEGHQDVLHGCQGCAAREAGQGPQAALVVGEQQVVAPPDRARERTSAFRPVTAGVLEQGEPVVEASRDVANGQRPHPGGGELDGQR
jgi:hypothetical protein